MIHNRGIRVKFSVNILKVFGPETTSTWCLNLGIVNIFSLNTEGILVSYTIFLITLFGGVFNMILVTPQAEFFVFCHFKLSQFLNLVG